MDESLPLWHGGRIHMSMSMRLHAVSDRQIDRCLREPERVLDAIGMRSVAAVGRCVGPVPVGGPRLRLTWGDEESADSFRTDDADSLDLEKAWHGLHFLLTGQARGGKAPLCFLFSGGVPVGGDMGYGPVRAIRSGPLATFHRAIQALSETSLRKRFEPQRMTREGVYPGIWQREPAGQCADWLCESFHQLREFVANAAHAGRGILICLS